MILWHPETREGWPRIPRLESAKGRTAPQRANQAKKPYEIARSLWNECNGIYVENMDSWQVMPLERRVRYGSEIQIGETLREGYFRVY